MEKPIIVLIIIAVVMLAGSNFASNVAIDLSAGEHAAGEAAVLRANAEGIQAQNQADQAVAEQALKDKAAKDAETLKTRILWANIWKWVGGIVGSLALLSIVAITVLNYFYYLETVNTRFASEAVSHRNGLQVGWTLPLLPGVLFLTHDDAPMVVAKLTAHAAPEIGEARDSIGLAMAHAVAERARRSSHESDSGNGFAEAMETLSNIVNARRLSSGK